MCVPSCNLSEDELPCKKAREYHTNNNTDSDASRDNYSKNGCSEFVGLKKKKNNRKNNMLMSKHVMMLSLYFVLEIIYE